MAPACRCSSCEEVISWLDAFGSNIQVALQLSLSLENSTAVLDRVQIRWLLCEQFWHKQTAGGNWWTHRHWVTSTCGRAAGHLLRPSQQRLQGCGLNKSWSNCCLGWTWNDEDMMKAVVSLQVQIWLHIRLAGESNCLCVRVCNGLVSCSGCLTADGQISRWMDVSRADSSTLAPSNNHLKMENAKRSICEQKHICSS